jgi:hypothetical protein
MYRELNHVGDWSATARRANPITNVRLVRERRHTTSIATKALLIAFFLTVLIPWPTSWGAEAAASVVAQDGEPGRAFEAAPRYCAKGELTYQSYGARGAVLVEQRWGFRLMVAQTRQWRLDMETKFPNPALSYQLAQVIAYDGGSIYSLASSRDVFSMADGKLRKVTLTNGLAAQSCARISPGPYPVDESSAVGVLWLAFFAGEYLSPSTNTMRFPNLSVSAPRSDPMAFICDITYKLRTDGDRPVLGAAEYRLNPSYLKADPGDFWELDEAETKEQYLQMSRLLQAYRASTPAAYTSAVYSLDEAIFTNKMLIPKSFHCDLMLAQDHNYRGVLYGRVTNLCLGTIEDLLPSVAPGIAVEDRRARMRTSELWRKSVIYKTGRSGLQVGTNDPVFVQALSSQPPARRQNWRAPEAPAKMVVRTLLLAVICLPLLYLLQRQFRQWRGRRKPAPTTRANAENGSNNNDLKKGRTT